MYTGGVSFVAACLVACAVFLGMHGIVTAAPMAVPVLPADTVITNCADDQQLRAAVNAVIGGGTTNITFNCGAGNHTIPIGGPVHMQVGGQVTIDGAGKITLDGQGQWSFFQVYSTAALTLTGLTLQRGTDATGSPIESFGSLTIERSVIRNNQMANSGAIVNNTGRLAIRNSTLSGNKSAAGNGGAVTCFDAPLVFLTIRDSTISGNKAGGNGGGVYSNCRSEVVNVTISGNQAAGGGRGGGGWYQEGVRAATIRFSTIADNQASFGGGVYNDGSGTSSMALQATVLAKNSGGNCDGVITSDGYNLADDTNCGAFTQAGDRSNIPLPLGALANNGGNTATHLLLPGNPALDAVPVAVCAVTADQRGVARPQRVLCDAGAVESAGALYLPFVRR
jgi:hypothetical protein